MKVLSIRDVIGDWDSNNLGNLLALSKGNEEDSLIENIENKIRD